VLKMLQSLPIDLTDEQRKSQMKKSQLGHVVMFLSKPEVEDNRANRRIAKVGTPSHAPSVWRTQSKDTPSACVFMVASPERCNQMDKSQLAQVNILLS